APFGIEKGGDGDVHRTGDVAVARRSALESRIFCVASVVPKAVRIRGQGDLNALQGGPRLGVREGA
ncbi:MAG: hypothetical protein VX323_05155, partial [Pseudomonadota bacterium]|nr:hypothetical protein [Pseudomonadota bacterium]